MIKRLRKLNKARLVGTGGKRKYVRQYLLNSHHLTAGKLYRILPGGGDSNLQRIKDDEGDSIYILLKGCAFLHDRDWEVVWM